MDRFRYRTRIWFAPDGSEVGCRNRLSFWPGVGRTTFGKGTGERTRMRPGSTRLLNPKWFQVIILDFIILGTTAIEGIGPTGDGVTVVGFTVVGFTGQGLTPFWTMSFLTKFHTKPRFLKMDDVRVGNIVVDARFKN
jgi:hypothetical protein